MPVPAVTVPFLSSLPAILPLPGNKLTRTDKLFTGTSAMILFRWIRTILKFIGVTNVDFVVADGLIEMERGKHERGICGFFQCAWRYHEWRWNGYGQDFFIK
jgi:hypothetical protein